MPYIFDTLKPYFGKWHSAAVFNPVQIETITMRGDTKFRAVSLFSGAGGLDIGVKQAGFDVRACLEIDPNCCETLRAAVAREGLQTRVVEGDIKKVDIDKLMRDLGIKAGELDLLFGGPPCQAFSLIGKQKSLEDERGMLLFQMTRYTKAFMPRVVLMEQVKGLLSAKDSDAVKGGVFDKLVREFAALGYVCKFKVCLAADYGVPQMRERVFLVATRGKNGFQFPTPICSKEGLGGIFPMRPYMTVGEALEGLGTPYRKQRGETMFDDSHNNHIDVTPARDVERMHYVPEGQFLAAQKNLPESLRGNLKEKDTTKFLRLSRSKPSNTLRCGEIFYHPTEDRYLTPREYMRIHGYPDSYLLKGPVRSRCGSVKNLDQHRQVANSVPPPMAFAMAKQINLYLSEGETI